MTPECQLGVDQSLMGAQEELGEAGLCLPGEPVIDELLQRRSPTVRDRFAGSAVRRPAGHRRRRPLFPPRRIVRGARCPEHPAGEQGRRRRPAGAPRLIRGADARPTRAPGVRWPAWPADRHPTARRRGDCRRPGAWSSQRQQRQHSLQLRPGDRHDPLADRYLERSEQAHRDAVGRFLCSHDRPPTLPCEAVEAVPDQRSRRHLSTATHRRR